MGLRDVNYVPPPTGFGQRLIVGAKKSENLFHFETLQDALAHIESLTGLDKPAADNVYEIDLLPGIYSGRFWIPDFVNLVASSEGAYLTTDGSLPSLNNDYILSIGVSQLSNIFVQPPIPDNPSQPLGAGILSRNNSSAYTKHQSSFVTPSPGQTLEITPFGYPKETIIMTGIENNAPNLASSISSQGIHLNARVVYGHVEIYSETSPGFSVTVHKEGTANSSFGFSTTEDTIPVEVIAEIGITYNVAIIGPAGNGLVIRDIDAGVYLFRDLLIAGCFTAINIIDNAKTLELINPIIFFNQIGIVIGENVIANIVEGTSFYNISVDLIVESEVRFFNFAYTTRQGDGIIIPSGSRMTFEFNLVGNAAIGRFDGERCAPFDCTLESVAGSIRLAGSAGSNNVVDIRAKQPGTEITSADTLYVENPGDRLTIPGGTNYQAGTGKLPSKINLKQHDRIVCNLIQKALGVVADIHVVLTAVVN